MEELNQDCFKLKEGNKKSGNMQMSFKKFMQKRKNQRKHSKQLKKVSAKKRRSPEFKEELRQKFIATAKKYIGIPYKRKYHEKGSELYNSPIFLDCCALVRQVVRDLREDFGFTLGRWNQNY